MHKIKNIDGLFEETEGYPLELWESNGRLLIRALNSAGNGETFIDANAHGERLPDLLREFSSAASE